MSKYTTGEMAKLCNVSVRTIQFYDTKGLLHPSDLTEGGRRLYNVDDLTKLRLICTLKVIGLSLDSIKAVMESESSGKVLSLLLDEQAKLLCDEISERQKQLEAIKVIKESLHNKTTIPINSIIDIESVMEKNKKVLKKNRRLLIFGSLLAIPQFALLALGIIRGTWMPFAIYMLIALPVAIAMVIYTFKDSVFICPECSAVFKPTLTKVFFTTGDSKVRWLTCTKCGHKGYCVETVTDDK